MQFAIDPMIASADRDGLAKADLCRQLNDSFRLTLLGGNVVLSQSVAGLPLNRQAEVVLAVRGFDNFSAENDPYEEHDFGAVVCRGERYFWKIDYYDLDLTYASPDPSDPAFTIRVLTIMRWLDPIRWSGFDLNA